MSGTAQKPCYFKFSAVPDVFKTFSAECDKDSSLKISTQPSLGLLERRYDTDGEDSGGGTQWARFARWVRHLNDTAEENVCYKVLYLTRHGLGYHNLKHQEIQTKEWNEVESHKDGGFLKGHGEVVWADSHLAPEGVAQAKELNEFWKDLTTNGGAPLPQKLYSSPLTRCLQTTRHIFESLVPTPSSENFHPVIKELLREQMTDHTCDRRSPRTVIEKEFPDYVIEEDWEAFPDQDAMWRADRWEPILEHVERKYAVLCQIFASTTTFSANDGAMKGRNESAFLSLTIHSYAIAVILAVCGADLYRVREGSSIAVLVRAEKVDEKPVLKVSSLENY